MKTSILTVLAVTALLPLVSKRVELVDLLTTSQLISLAELDSPKDGDPAPTLTCKDASGMDLDWAQFKDRAVILFFHSARTRNAHAAVDSLVESLERAKDLKKHTTVLLLVDDPTVGAAMGTKLSSTGFVVRVGLDTKRTDVTQYGVIAFPSVYVIDGQGRIVGSTKGYSTFLGFRIVTACRYALGIIDAAQFEALRNGRSSHVNADQARDALRSRMELRLVEAGHGSAALPQLRLRGAEPKPSPDILRLLVHLCVLAGEGQEAEAWLERLEAIEPADPAIPLFRIRLELARGRVEGANAKLDELRTSGPQLDRVRAQILEQEGRWEEAAKLYRDALDCFLFLPSR